MKKYDKPEYDKNFETFQNMIKINMIKKYQVSKYDKKYYKQKVFLLAE